MEIRTQTYLFSIVKNVAGVRRYSAHTVCRKHADPADPDPQH